MFMDFLWLAVGIGACGYFIGEGLKNFGNPSSSYESKQSNYLIKEKELYLHLGIKKDEVKIFLDKYKDIPRIELGEEMYYPNKQLRNWLNKNHFSNIKESGNSNE